MGWTGYYPTHFYSGGVVNRKAECDAYFLEGLNAGYYNLVKSRMVGSTYYAAVQHLKRYVCGSNGKPVKDANGQYVIENVPAREIKTIGVVFLTQVEKGMFYYKDMSETMGPCYYDCPAAILEKLSPTDNKEALAWREKCWEKLTKPSLSTLPIGTIIRFERNGSDVWLQKCAPNHQFRTPWWKVDGECMYYSKKRIPTDFEIVKMGDVK